MTTDIGLIIIDADSTHCCSYLFSSCAIIVFLHEI